MIPKIVQGGNFSDYRGIISYLNDFSFRDIERFYIISNSKLMSFSILPLTDVKEDDVRYPANYWLLNE
ncbi:hypothetical protein [Flavobacterium daemonense]|uniref:hypothetical protein n=1 Tax=Flavobacterium daemonense TaxID=1393049 RepID=UPI001186DEBD|nr:hypothetical protein [Flavobacterium daemonense]KAF2333135.1 hypothetical protein FND99_10895 [Flavobacterium daemonense]